MALTIKDLPIGAKVDIGLTVDGHKAWFEKLADNHYGKNEATLYPTHILSRKAFDAKEPKNEIENRQKYGNNNVRLSNLMQWLNSDEKDWYVNQHDADQAPTSDYVSQRPYADEPGFLTYLQPQVRQYLIAVTRTAIEPSTDGGGTKNYEAKAFPLSRTEIGLGNEREADGKPFSQFDSDESRIATRIGTTSKDWYWLSTPYASNTNIVRSVSSDGTLNSSNANYGNRGVRPALTFVNDTPVRKIGDNYEVPYNKPPTITLTETSGRTLYEGGTLNLEGEAKDVDKGDVVTIRAQINNGPIQTLAATLSDGINPVPYNTKWTYSVGAIYTSEGVKVIDGLKENTSHRLRVWAEDDKGGKSVEEERSFQIVLNRPPSVTLKEVKYSGLLPTDSATLTGQVSDPDGNDISVKIKVGNKDWSEEVHLESGSTWEVDVPISDFTEGANPITVVATDTYGAKTQKTFSGQLSFEGQTLDKFVVRYDLNPKKTSMIGLIAWAERSKNATTNAYISITSPGEKEDYSEMELTNSVDIDKITEDEFDAIKDTAGTEIVMAVKVKNGQLYKISGAFQPGGEEGK